MFNYFNFWGGFGFPIYKKVLYIGPNLQYTFNNSYSFINDKLNKNVGNTPGAELRIDFDTEKISANASFGYRMNMVKNVINPQSNQKNDIYKVSFYFKYQMPLKFILETDFDYFAMRGLSADYNTNYFLWNAAFGKKFFKRDQLRIDLIANDILNQNKSISRFNSVNVITDSRKLIITRYFLLKLTYQFNSSKIKTNGED